MAPPSSNGTSAGAIKRKFSWLENEAGTQLGASTQSLTLLAEVATAGSEDTLCDNVLSPPKLQCTTDKAGRPPRGPSRKTSSGGSGSQDIKGDTAPSKVTGTRHFARTLQTTSSGPTQRIGCAQLFCWEPQQGSIAANPNHGMIVAAAPAGNTAVLDEMVTEVGLLSMQQRLTAMHQFYARQQDAYLQQAETYLATLRSKSKPGSPGQQADGVQAVVRTLQTALHIMQRSAHLIAASTRPAAAEQPPANGAAASASTAALQHARAPPGNPPAPALTAAPSTLQPPSSTAYHCSPAMPTRPEPKTQQPQQLQLFPHQAQHAQHGQQQAQHVHTQHQAQHAEHGQHVQRGQRAQHQAQHAQRMHHQALHVHTQHQAKHVQTQDSLLQLLHSGAVPLVIPALTPVAGGNPLPVQAAGLAPLLQQFIQQQWTQKQEEHRHRHEQQQQQQECRQQLLQQGLQAAQATVLNYAPDSWVSGQHLPGQRQPSVYGAGIHAKA